MHLMEGNYPGLAHYAEIIAMKAQETILLLEFQRTKQLYIGFYKEYYIAMDRKFKERLEIKF